MPTELTIAPQATQPSLLAIVDRLLTNNPTASIEVVQKMLEMQERWEINQDKRALREAMAEFKKNPPAIVKDRIAKVTTKTGGTFEYSFADLDAITRESQVALAQRGVTHGYTITETGPTISVTCILKFGMYDEPGATLSAGPDTSGTKNDIQAKASTVSYLEKYTFMAAAGLAAGMPDKDGNNVLDTTVINLRNDILTAGDLADLKELYTAAMKTTKKTKEDQPKQKAYIDAYNQRKAELTPKDGE